MNRCLKRARCGGPDVCSIMGLPRRISEAGCGPRGCLEAEKTTEEQEAGDSRSCVRDSIVAVESDLIMVEDIV